MSITTLSLLKRQAVIDHNDDDELLQQKLDAAEGYIARWCGIDLATLNPFPADLKEAALMLASYWYGQREAAAATGVNHIPFGVYDLIQPFRQWTMQHVE